jgi:hypothetical protein
MGMSGRRIRHPSNLVRCSPAGTVTTPSLIRRTSLQIPGAAKFSCKRNPCAMDNATGSEDHSLPPTQMAANGTVRPLLSSTDHVRAPVMPKDRREKRGRSSFPRLSALAASPFPFRFGRGGYDAYINGAQLNGDPTNDEQALRTLERVIGTCKKSTGSPSRATSLVRRWASLGTATSIGRPLQPRTWVALDPGPT